MYNDKKCGFEIGNIIFGCEITNIKGSSYTLKCMNCQNIYTLKYTQLKDRKRNVCKCKYDSKNVREDLTNRQYGDLVVVALDTDMERRENFKVKYGAYRTFWKCQCTKCGNISYKPKNELDGIVKRNASGCNNCFGDCLTGRRYGRLVVLSSTKKDKGAVYWECQCDCGNKIWVDKGKLNSGNTQSCGCLFKDAIVNRNKENCTWNGDSGDPRFEKLYNSWCSMRQRCNSPNYKNYNNYGGRGITICEEWNDWFNFKEWSLNNGWEQGLTLDRIDVNGNYEPSNCRWATIKVQANNKRNNKMIEYQGRTQSLAQWCDELGLEYHRTKARLNVLHMSVEEAFVNELYINNGSREKRS